MSEVINSDVWAFLVQACGGEEAARNTYVTVFAEDPAGDYDRDTRARMWAGGPVVEYLQRTPATTTRNLYMAVGDYAPGEDGRVRRRAGKCRRVRHVMIDDVGTGPGAKVDPADIKLPPTWAVETSPGNCQLWYRLDPPAENIRAFDRTVDALISRGLAKDNDPGMKGCTRYGRLPFGANTKAKYWDPDAPAGFRVRLVPGMTDFTRAYSLEEFARAYGIDDALAEPAATPAPAPIAGAVRGWDTFNDKLLSALTERGCEPAEKHDTTGVYVLRVCPFADKHGDGAGGDGAAVALLGAECDGEVYGRGWFRCHHGHGQADRLSELLELLGLLDEYTALAARADFAADTRPAVDLRGGYLDRALSQAIDVLAAGAAARNVFVRGRALVTPYYNDKRVTFKDRPTKSLELSYLTQANVAVELTALAKFRRGNGQRINCPAELARAVLDSPAQWGPLPRVDTIAAVPLWTPSGELVAKPGYHPQHRAWLDVPPGIQHPGGVTREAALDALRYLWQWLSDFPFATKLDRAVAVAALVSAAVRPSLSYCPGFLFDAPEYGAGKSTLNSLVNIVATGHEPPVMSYTEDRAERQKLLDAAMLEGRAVIVLDNVPEGTVLECQVITVMLTQPEREVRRLGVSQTFKVPCQQLITLTGNNITIGRDLTRRILPLRLMPPEDVLTRTFKRPELLADAQAARVDILNAIFKLIAYRGEREPLMLAGYRDWCDIVARPLVSLGMEDPVTAILSAVKRDPTRNQLDAILCAIEGVFGNRPFRGADLIDAPLTDSAAGRIRNDYLLPALLDAGRVSKDGRTVDLKALGEYLAGQVDRITASRRALRTTDALGARRAAWFVERLPGAPELSFKSREETT